MAFMEIEVLRKGACYCADCDKCGMTLTAHEWADWDFNERRDAMEAGTLRCDECNGRADASTFTRLRNQYAGRYSAPGYMDCTPWEYDTNVRRLERTLRQLYAE